MEMRTFRARTVPEALELVRRELGPDATVLHTRVVGGGWWGRLAGGRGYEVAAAEAPPAPPAAHRENREHDDQDAAAVALPSPAAAASLAAESGRAVDDPDADLLEMPEGLFQAYVDLIEADADEGAARELVERLRRTADVAGYDPQTVRRRLLRLLGSELPTTGPLRLAPGRLRTVALVGPTGVGKTTTLAKLAAAYRLQENRQVGLITVDTYRIAAVEQLRTYAEIIDLPMEVVGSPREMRRAMDRFRDFDLALIDTAGRSPHDDVKIRELRTILHEAAPDEIHLVLSAASSSRSLLAAIQRFAPVGVTAAVVTKLDETDCFGHLLTPWHAGRLPLSYLTDGQNVPDDICVADPREVAEAILAPVGPWAPLRTAAGHEVER